jgi:catechol 2,3-dioxygenase-like lactoylglutathione lyase family enzyme
MTAPGREGFKAMQAMPDQGDTPSPDAPTYLGLDHVQLTVPPGSEARAREFYCDVLGMPEVEKPEALKPRGGLWLRVGAHEVHLGIEEPQAESRRHPGIVVEALAPLRQRLARAGIDTDVDRPPERPGFNRIHFRDPFGNRLEFMEKAT